MESGNFGERRKEDRRKSNDRRTGEFDAIYQKLVANIIGDRRQGERRKNDRRKQGFTPVHEQSYYEYLNEIESANMDREKAGQEPLPILSMEKWMDRLKN